MAHKNPLIDFLRNYGPIAAQDNLYDERIGDALEQFGVKRIEVHPAKVDSLVNNFASPFPINTILTGTAGDGKTFHCRRVFELLGGKDDIWRRGTKYISIPLPNSRKELVIVKDLSELTDNDKEELISANFLLFNCDTF